MIAYSECVPCLINQGLNAVRKLNLDKDKEMQIVLEVVKYLSSFNRIDRSPAYYAYFVQSIVKKHANCEDPFYEIKKTSNAVALKVTSDLRDLSFEDAVFLSGAGNAIDFAIIEQSDMSCMIDRIFKMEKGKFEIDKLKEKLEHARSVLIIGDNAGEIVFDKLLAKVIKDLKKEIFYAVKSYPILNDVLMDDAIEVGMDMYCQILVTGSGKVGTDLSDCSREFLDVFYGVDVVISKGQANYETLSNVDRDIFFLLTVKCIPIQTELDSPRGKVCLLYKS